MKKEIRNKENGSSEGLGFRSLFNNQRSLSMKTTQNPVVSFGLYIPEDLDLIEVEAVAKHNNIFFTVDPLKTSDFGYGTEFYYWITGKVNDIKNFLEEIGAETDLVEFEELYKGNGGPEGLGS